ncbi:hypothetical protein Poly41_37850 [Novipirellula artificiosorum]|uniref:Uncharacterized protein n=1 Tax=Novipirellula artificiosorum TaxID=2528016 RepID=A0A5C6DHL0_9BACT|nr:hypothetical protein Poly41_37850 [Novipirellula artificiosorum]
MEAESSSKGNRPVGIAAMTGGVAMAPRTETLDPVPA